MHIATFFTSILFASLVLLATDAVADDEIYRWVDENGVVHFDDLPDPKTNSEVIEIKSKAGNSTLSAPAYSSPAATDGDQQEEPTLSAAQQKRADRAEKRKEAAEMQAAVAAGCKQRRQLIAQLEPSPRVMVTNKDGTVGRMDDNERLKILTEAESYIANKCNN